MLPLGMAVAFFGLSDTCHNRADNRAGNPVAVRERRVTSMPPFGIAAVYGSGNNLARKLVQT